MKLVLREFDSEVPMDKKFMKNKFLDLKSECTSHQSCCTCRFFMDDWLCMVDTVIGSAPIDWEVKDGD